MGVGSNCSCGGVCELENLQRTPKRNTQEEAFGNRGSEIRECSGKSFYGFMCCGFQRSDVSTGLSALRCV